MYKVDFGNYFNVSGKRFGVVGGGTLAFQQDSIVLSSKVRWVGTKWYIAFACVVVAFVIIKTYLMGQTAIFGLDGLVFLYVANLFFLSSGQILIDRKTVSKVGRKNCTVHFSATDPRDSKLRSCSFSVATQADAQIIEAMLVK